MISSNRIYPTPQAPPATNKRIIIGTKSVPSHSFVCAEEIPEPAEYQVRIKMIASPITMFDVMQKKGLFPSKGHYVTPGITGVGRIDKFGRNVTIEPRPSLQTLCVVFSITGGCYSTYICVDLRNIIVFDEHILSPLQLAVLSTNYFIAFYLMHNVSTVFKYQKSLIVDAEGGVGNALVILCKHEQMILFAMANTKYHPFISQYGCRCVDPIDKGLGDYVLRNTFGGVDIIFDPFYPYSSRNDQIVHQQSKRHERLRYALRSEGQMVLYGLLTSNLSTLLQHSTESIMKSKKKTDPSLGDFQVYETNPPLAYPIPAETINPEYKQCSSVCRKALKTTLKTLAWCGAEKMKIWNNSQVKTFDFIDLLQRTPHIFQQQLLTLVDFVRNSEIKIDVTRAYSIDEVPGLLKSLDQLGGDFMGGQCVVVFDQSYDE